MTNGAEKKSPLPLVRTISGTESQHSPTYSWNNIFRRTGAGASAKETLSPQKELEEMRDFIREVGIQSKSKSEEMESYDDVRIMDASYITSNGPFRFRRTQHISLHLSLVNGTEILIYLSSDMKRFLENHKGELTNRERRVLRHALGFLTITYALLFFQENMKTDLEKQEEFRLRQHSWHLPIWLPIWRTKRSSIDIAKELGITMRVKDWRRYMDHLNSSESKDLTTCLRGGQDAESDSSDSESEHESGSESETANDPRYSGGMGIQRAFDQRSKLRLNNPFEKKATKLYKMFSGWKPTTVLQLRYAGYGAVDAVGMAAFYVGAIALFISISTISITIAQTYAAFKALP